MFLFDNFNRYRKVHCFSLFTYLDETKKRCPYTLWSFSLFSLLEIEIILVKETKQTQINLKVFYYTGHVKCTSNKSDS